MSIRVFVLTFIVTLFASMLFADEVRKKDFDLIKRRVVPAPTPAPIVITLPQAPPQPPPFYISPTYSASPAHINCFGRR